MSQYTPEDILSQFITVDSRCRLAPEVLEKAVHCLLDALSLSVLARDHPVVAAVKSIGVDCSDGGATSWSCGATVSVSDAFLINGTATHAFFQDDTDMVAWGHPASLISPVAVGIAERRQLSITEALQGLVAGYATFTWLGADETVARQLVTKGLRAGPTLGAIAAAAAGACTLGLSAQSCLDAIGIASDSTGGVLEPVRCGAQDWRLQNGFAAQRGGAAAMLAEAGVKGPESPLTGPSGFLRAFADSQVPEAWRKPPQQSSIMDVWFKPYPTLGDNMAPAVAAAAMAESAPPAQDIDRVVIRMNSHFASYPGTQYRGPFERTEQMIASTAFAVSALLVHGKLVYEDYVGLGTDDVVLDLVGKTEIIPMDSFGYLDGTVEVHAGGTMQFSDARETVQTAMFRDRATTTAVLQGRHGRAAARTADALFKWLDGEAPEPAVGEVLAALATWRLP